MIQSFSKIIDNQKKLSFTRIFWSEIKLSFTGNSYPGIQYGALNLKAVYISHGYIWHSSISCISFIEGRFPKSSIVKTAI